MKLLLLTHAAATLFMVGLIWFVQVVHYPLFDGVGDDGFAGYEARHSRLTTWVVAPPMLIELATAALLLVYRPAGVSPWLTGAGFALVGVVWLSTWLLQVPQHTRLMGGFDASAHGVLVATNWLRTFAWTARGGVVLAMLHAAMR